MLKPPPERSAFLRLISTAGEHAGTPRIVENDDTIRVIFNDVVVEGPVNDASTWGEALEMAQERTFGYRGRPYDETRRLLGILTHPDQASVLHQARTAQTEGPKELRRFLAMAIECDEREVDWDAVERAVRSSHRVVLANTRLSGLAQIIDGLTRQLRTDPNKPQCAAVTSAIDELRDALNALDDAVNATESELPL